MDNGFQLLEDKVRKAVDLVKRLRQENAALAEELGTARRRLRDAEGRADAPTRSKPAGDGQEVEALKGELTRLRRERDQVRERIAKLIEALDGLE